MGTIEDLSLVTAGCLWVLRNIFFVKYIYPNGRRVTPCDLEITASFPKELSI